MKSIILELPQGAIDWAKFDPSHTIDKPLFSGAYKMPDGRFIVGYKGFLPFEEWEPGSISITNVQGAEYVSDDNTYIIAKQNIPLTITCAYSGPDAIWSTPIRHPFGHVAYFKTESIGGVLTITTSLDTSGLWEIKQEMINERLLPHEKLKFTDVSIVVQAN